ARARARRGDGPGWCWCCSSCSYSGPLLPGVSPAPEGPRPQEGGPIRRPRRKPRQIRDWRPAPHARRPLVAASRLRGRLSPLLEAGRALLAAAPPVAKAAVALGRGGGLQLGGELLARRGARGLALREQGLPGQLGGRRLGVGDQLGQAEGVVEELAPR